jgi:hypothetical protein
MEQSVVSAVVVICIVVGMTLAYCADRFPGHAEILELAGGTLLVGGLAILGAAMPALVV